MLKGPRGARLPERGRDRRPSRAAVLLAVMVGIAGAGRADAAGPPVIVSAEEGVDASVLRRVRDVVSSRRAVRDELSLPPADAVSADQAVMVERAASIRLALGRARRAESEAAWDACVREAADALPAAIEVLSKVNDLELLRDLHIQIGTCLTLAGSAPSARPYFVSAALLDETAPKVGLHREEAEKLQADARAEVLARARGVVHIETVPPGAEVWLDGRKAVGVTPLGVDVRLGDHYVTARRFRYELNSGRLLLQPSSTARVVLEAASRYTLRDQLAAIAAAVPPAPPADELRLARAVWSRAEQVVDLRRVDASTYRLEVLDAVTGQRLKTAKVASADDDDTLRRAVCDALGETCEPKARGIPWYVWPIGGLALVGGVVSAVFIVNSKRSYTFVACPAGMTCQ